MKHYYLLALIGVLLLPLSLSAQTIEDGVLSGCMSLSGRYVVPDEVSKIDNFAFFSSSVTEVVIGKNVKEIGNAAFQNCMTLERITFAPDSKLERIGDDVFGDCPKLVEIALPEGLQRMGARTFWLNESLKQVTLPSTLDTLPKYCFQGCTSLRKMRLPEGMKVIAENALAGCENLMQVTLPTTLDSIATKAFYKNLGLLTLTIPEGVRSIADSAFMRCENLETVTLPASLERVGAKLFRRCPELTAISVATGSKHFVSREGVLYSADLKTLYEAPAKFKSEDYKVPAETETIYHYAFYECPEVQGITIPQTIKRIGVAALVNNGMRQFTFPGNDKYWLANGSLYYKATTQDGEQTVFMAHPSGAEGEAIVSYGTSFVSDYALAGCHKISSLRLPSTLLGMGAFVLSGCKGLKDISSYAIEPPVLTEESLIGLDLPSVRLHVYPAAMKKYMSAPYWQLILHGDDLTGEEPRAIASLEQQTTQLTWSYQHDGILHIKSQSTVAMQVALYSTDGVRITTLELAPHATAQLALPTAGIYFLSSISSLGSQTEQIIL
ncbi:MAG: leucine-rich repeat protein [Porphyromonas sp.]|uniref:leucine-rich repeat domain-containing protein n=1 Tax=Porphyromonas sp. TaxID=1924944 RepID=UPI002A74B2A5|nr:leucine-rich repeat protein [Porphyromonas sp.]MDD6929128.1 leucine-rich repeat protein [Bacteroidales bacterium]MDY3111390.1 leucine-rich repeat protein [Porphyromonas sp.]MDY4245924.1 leucine-rich repeat protein [Porphyromonas sp.]